MDRLTLLFILFFQKRDFAMSSKTIEDYPTYNWKAFKTMKDNFYKSPPLFDIGDEAFEREVVEFLPRKDRLKILGIGSGRGKLMY